MSNLTVLVFLVSMFVVAQHGLAVRNVTTTDAIATQADGRAEIVNSSQLENIRVPRSTRHAHRRHKHAKLTKYIVNGFPARKGQFPYLVAVYSKPDMTFRANGAIISSNHVLTTAHYLCKARGERAIAPHDLVVHAGMVNRQAHDNQVYDVQDTMCHEQYYPPDDIMHRIALIKIINYFRFTSYVTKIQMSTRRYNADLDVTIAGWGHTTEQSDELSEQAQYGYFYTLSLEKCRQRTRGRYYNQKFFSAVTGCADSLSSKGPYMRRYDEGAPVVHDGHLVGIVAWNSPGDRVVGYVSVPHHIDWIRLQRRPLESDLKTTSIGGYTQKTLMY